MIDNMPKNDQEWKDKLTAGQYKVLREKGTEAPFTGQYHDKKDQGIYVCAGCGEELFSSDTKFDSGTGWPSFDKVMSNDKIELHDDSSLFMHRTEVTCKKCGGHLGHVFPDGPTQSGQRFCINSCSLDFKGDK